MALDGQRAALRIEDAARRLLPQRARAAGLARLGYGIEKTHADGRFEIAGVSREVVEAFSTRRAEIEAAVAERGGGDTAGDQRLAQRAALMTRAAKRDVDRDALRESWERQAAEWGSMRGRSPPKRRRGRPAGTRGRTLEARWPDLPGGTGPCPALAPPWTRTPQHGRARRVRPRRRGRRMGGGASLRARGGVRPHRPARRRARPRPRRGADRGRRARGQGGPRDCRDAARRGACPAPRDCSPPTGRSPTSARRSP